MLGARIVLAAMAAEAAMAFNCMSPATAFRSLSRVHSHPAPRSARLGLLRMAGGSPMAAADEKRREGSADKFALLFDCDGVIVLTEELHRLAYNGAFQDYSAEINGQPVNWSVEYYDVLQNTVGGGKPKMKWHFNNNGWPTSKLGGVPSSEDDQNRLIDELQDKKTEIYKKIVNEVAEARPGVLSLMDEAIKTPGIAVGICSAATKAGFEQVVNSVVGTERLSKLDVVIAGDDVPRKKPDPIIYQLASERIGVPPSRCIVVEDSLVGLRAAKGAGMKCIITYTESTKDQDFYGEGADAVVADLSQVGRFASHAD
ncbi:hypothetical protein GUITHDRAFT_84455 [Guillardia theta CCMP2712]|uniref:Uncharacterized protein n=1 Tax=Guillardia theta (strain CCMP2712) TaxID=905079 RepID=L1JYV8_GUITC|nr:hypothetical protein GUITHDRAFT_84455 [Guillardia theta CCMP2712]EKX53524.1 hypothetical protein GUITHDRAFT_84455 [Guillardia theta CCMP2712]|eukprot:XP_005840504.1 hypothetical protein GUITHDRAFT_84455 [Guillardia theta CCMP2712]